MPKELRFHLLGSVAIFLGEQPISPMRSRSAEALLIYLALHKKSFARQVLADFFWDNRPQERAMSNLRTVLAMLRRHFPEHLHITRHTVAFNHDAPHWLDVTAFRASNPQSPISHLQSLITLYRADFLSGFSLPESHGFQEWALLMREQLRQRAAVVLHKLTEAHLASSDYDHALPYARRLLEINPLDDLAQRRLMELLWRSGQRNAALQQYRKAHDVLAQELGVAPDPATTALYERLGQAPFPPPRRLPAPLTGFVGREAELAQIVALLDDPRARLVTILGPGGIGKTRLLLEAAHHIARTRPGRFIDGITFVPLAGLTSAEFLPTTLARQFDLIFQGSDEPFEQLLDYLRPRELLLALDNVEHLLTPRSRRWLARIAQEAPDVRLLLSSRARLGLQGERLLALQGLSDAAAQRLFLARATAVSPTFAPGAAESEAIERLCALVEGIPLALELSAAGVRTLSCAEIIEQVQSRLDWQFANFPDRPRRHQNLEALFEQSWSLLATEEQEVARRLSVFNGPFDVAGARVVAGATPGQMATLRDHSLLESAELGWFHLHPLVRRFLVQKLQSDPTLAHEIKRCLVEYIVQLRIVTGGTNMESRYIDLQQVMERQHEQVIAGTLWLARQRDFSGRKLVTLVEVLIFYYSHSSQFESWKVTFQQLLQALAQGEGEEEKTAWLSAVLRSRIAEADLALHAYDRAQGQFEALLPQAYELRNGALISFCHHKLAQLAGRRGDFDDAYDHFAAAIPPLEEGQYPQQYHFPVYRSWTEVALVDGDLEQARAVAEKAYVLALEVDSRLEAEPIYLWALGEIALAQGDLAQAREKLEQALHVAREKGYWVDELRATISLATVLAALEPDTTAAELAQAAYDLALGRHDRRFMAFAARALGHAAASLGDHTAACAHFKHSRALLAAIGDRAELLRTPAN
jgi:DNA-binding SARP family transcriptional activator/ABC-type lipoprotein export system ATPase subunit